MSRPKTYSVNRLSCLDCKYLIIGDIGYYCSYGESQSEKDLLSDLEWKRQNPVSLCGYCENLEKEG